MIAKHVRQRVEALEGRTLFSLPFGPSSTIGVTLNPAHSVVEVNLVSGPLLSADFNNDGNADLVFGGRNGADDSNTHYLGVMLGSASGQFTDAGTLQATVQFGDTVTHPALSAYAVGDFNGDGNQDLAAIYTIADGTSFDYHLLVGFGNGDGTFTVQPTLSFDSTSFVPSNDSIPPASIAVGKFNGGSDDQMIVVVPNDSATQAIDVLGLDNTNHFARLGVATLNGLAGGDDQIVTGHFDSGTLPDAAVYDPVASKAVMLINGTGDDFLSDDPISIAPAALAATSSLIAAGDFNGDGKTDLVVEEGAGGINNTNLDVLLNNGFGGVTALAPVADISPGLVDTAFDFVKVGDFDGNGSVDVATRFGLFRSDGAGHLLYSGLGTFNDTFSPDVAVGDFNGDGALDLISAGGPISDTETLELKLGTTPTTLNTATIKLNDQSIKNGVGADTTAKFSVTVSGTSAAPTGTVDLYATNVSNSSIVDLGTASLTDGQATLTSNNIPAGTNHVVAAYSGDAEFLGGVSDPVTVYYVGGGSGSVASVLQSGIIKSSLPAVAIGSVKLGKSVTVAIKNSGSALFKDSTTVNVFASLDGTIDPTDTLVGTVTKTLKIAALKTTNIVIPIKSLPASLSGQYVLLEETVEAGIQTSASLPGPSINLTKPVVALVPVINQTVISPNGLLITQLTVTNNGNIPSSGTTQILLYGSSDATVAHGTLLLKQSLAAHLKPGMKMKVKLTANALETQLEMASLYCVAEIIDSAGNIETASAPAPH